MNNSNLNDALNLISKLKKEGKDNLEVLLIVSKKFANKLNSNELDELAKSILNKK